MQSLEENADSLVDFLCTRPSHMRNPDSLKCVAKYWGVRSQDVFGYAQIAFKELVHGLGCCRTLQCMALDEECISEHIDYLEELGLEVDLVLNG